MGEAGLQRRRGDESFFDQKSRKKKRRADFFSVALALVLLFVITKVFFIANFAWHGELGKVSSVRVLSWFSQDCWTALGCAVICVVLGFVESGLNNAIDTKLKVLASGFLVMVCIAHTMSTFTYNLIGMAPTQKLLKQLGDVDQASDSLLSLLSLKTVAILVGFLVVVFAVRHVSFRRFQRSRVGLRSFLAVALVVAMLSFFPRRDFLDLDRNGIFSFVSSALVDEPTDPLDADSLDGSEIDLAKTLAPIFGVERQVPPSDFSHLAQWRDSLREQGKEPNVVLVILESTSINYMHVTGGAYENTPNLTRFAKSSLFWKQHYTHIPQSMPSIYSILCSQFGVPLGDVITRVAPQVNCQSISEVLSKRGYKSSLWHSGRFSFYSKDKFFKNRNYEPYIDAVTMPNRSELRQSSWGIEESAAVDELVKWAAKQTQPFFSTYIPVYPHHPYLLPKGEPRKFGLEGDKGLYIDATYYVDQMMGRLVKGIEDAGLADETLFVFVGDHGEGFGEHQNSYIHGGTLFEEGIKTFTIWYAPGAVSSSVYNESTAHTDIAPTLLEFLGSKRSKPHMGQSRMHSSPSRLIPIFTDNAFRFVGFLDGQWKYFYNTHTDGHRFFDLNSDPKEKHNLSYKYASRMPVYKERVRRFIAQQRYHQKQMTTKDKSNIAALKKSPPAATKRWVPNFSNCKLAPGAEVYGDGSHLRMVRWDDDVTTTCRWDVKEGEKLQLSKLLVGAVVAQEELFIDASLQYFSGENREGLGYCERYSKTCDITVNRIVEGPGVVELDLRFFHYSGKKVPLTADHSYCIHDVWLEYSDHGLPN